MKLKNQNLFQEKSYINGEWIGGEKRFAVTNPATGKDIANVADLSKSSVEDAVDAADKAFADWAAMRADERARLMEELERLIYDNLDDLATIMTMEQGKPLKESKGEIKYAAGFIKWFAEEARRAYGETIPSPFDDARILTLRQPVGPCAIITPWNFPSAMITRKAAAAWAAGCTVVARPAQDTPLSALALAVLAEEAGFPAGVFNVVTGSNSSEMGEVLSQNPKIKKLSFTGSTKVGKILMKQASGTMKRVSFELGGNAPFIVFPDADIDAAVEGAIACKFRNAGQTCVCANRFYIHEDVYDEFAEKFVAAVKDLKVGNGLQDDTDIGPLISKDGLEKVQSLLKDADKKGGKILAGGEVDELGGTFFQPTVIGNASDDMDLSCEEIFGPVAPLFKFREEEDVIRQANNTQFGLASYFYGRDIGQIWRVAEALEYGMVAVNSGMLSTPVAPFGGVKESGFGREGSAHGLDEYMSIKYVLLSGLAN